MYMMQMNLDGTKYLFAKEQKLQLNTFKHRSKKISLKAAVIF